MAALISYCPAMANIPLGTWPKTANWACWWLSRREQSIAISARRPLSRHATRAEQHIVYVVKTAKGQEIFTPKEFAKKFTWKNDPDKVRLSVK